MEDQRLEVAQRLIQRAYELIEDVRREQQERSEALAMLSARPEPQPLPAVFVSSESPICRIPAPLEVDE